ncbi:hypothetical protein ACFHWW_33565 [Ensifer sp. P24N7]|uniref:hypothetical protein n=1 Tax=Sinorhizobium sp. P24N7 TaxID=3348358 RepID=UPI0035F43567
MAEIFHFLLLRLALGDPAAIIAGKSATEEMIAGIGGDSGTSIFTERLQLISPRLEPIISVTILTMILSVTTGPALCPLYPCGAAQ